MMDFKLASLILYASFISLTVYQIYRDGKDYKGGECIFEIGMCVLELAAMISEFISMKATVFAYFMLLGLTIVDIFCHKEDD